MNDFRIPRSKNSRLGVYHYIVSGASWGEDGILFRRNRLTEYLLHHEKTAGVYYIYPSGIRIKHPIKDFKSLNQRTGFLPNNVFQIALPDNRGWMRYGNILGRYIQKRLLKYIHKDALSFLWFTNPSYAGLADLPVWDKVIYDCSDYWNRPPSRPNKIKSEKKIISRSNYIFATSQFLVDYIETVSKKSAILIENGVDFNMFTTAEPCELTELPSPRLGFVGGMKSKIDYGLLLFLAKRDVGINIVLIGPIVDKNNEKLSELLRLPNVYSIGPVESKVVPSYMKTLDVGLLPYKKIDYNLAVSPLKLFEYLSVGLPCVGTGVPSTKKYMNDGIYYFTESGYEEFYLLCKKAYKRKNDDLNKKRRIELARENDWSQKFSAMLDVVQLDYNPDKHKQERELKTSR